MDYDSTNIPAAYDRGRDHGPEMLALWMRAMAAYVEGRAIERILDLGCGTGRFSEALAAHFEAEVVGVDPSLKMLARAREKRTDDRVQYQPGNAEAIPLAAHTVDMIFISMSFHHFRDAPRAARECRRVLRAQGTVFVRTGSREQIERYPYVPFFPTSLPLLIEHLPEVAQVRGAFESAGFHTVATELITQTIAPDLATYAEKIATGADSVLARLSHQDFEAGLAALRAAAAEHDGIPVAEPIDLLVFR